MKIIKTAYLVDDKKQAVFIIHFNNVYKTSPDRKVVILNSFTLKLLFLSFILIMFDVLVC